MPVDVHRESCIDLCCRLSVVKTYCGHGIGDLFHCAPNVPHYRGNKAVGTMKEGQVCCPCLSQFLKQLHGWSAETFILTKASCTGWLMFSKKDVHFMTTCSNERTETY